MNTTQICSSYIEHPSLVKFCTLPAPETTLKTPNSLKLHKWNIRTDYITLCFVKMLWRDINMWIQLNLLLKYGEPLLSIIPTLLTPSTTLKTPSNSLKVKWGLYNLSNFYIVNKYIFTCEYNMFCKYRAPLSSTVRTLLTPGTNWKLLQTP